MNHIHIFLPNVIEGEDIVRKLSAKNRIVAIKWVTYILTGISCIIILLNKFIFIDGHINFYSVIYLIISLFFFQPLISAIDIVNEKSILKNRQIFIMLGLISAIFFYSSYQLFIIEDHRINLWFWMALISVVILLVTDIISNFLKAYNEYLEIPTFKRFFKSLNRIRPCHFYFICMLIFILVNVYDSPKELSLVNLDIPSEIMITKIHTNDVGKVSIGDRIRIKDKDTIQDIYKDITANKTLKNIRGAEYFRLARASNKSNFYYSLYLNYNSNSIESKYHRKTFNSIDIYPNRYTTINKHKIGINIFTPHTWRYNITFSPRNIKKIEEAFLEN